MEDLVLSLTCCIVWYLIEPLFDQLFENSVHVFLQSYRPEIMYELRLHEFRDLEVKSGHGFEQDRDHLFQVFVAVFADRRYNRSQLLDQLVIFLA